MYARLLLLLLLPILMLISACRLDIYTGLEEEQANAMLSVLLKRGIQAEKAPAGKNGYTISVDETELIEALQILRENSLPKDSFASLGTVFAGSGMISSALEENARLTWAISQELSNTFSRIDGVLTARVHVVLGVNDPLNNIKLPPSATVFLRHNPESIVVNMVADIRKGTASAVPGLNYDNVTVMLVPVRETVTIPKVTRKSALLFDEYFSLPIFLQTLAITLSIVALCIGLVLLWQRRKKKSQENVENADAKA